MKKKIKICQFCGVQYPYEKFLKPLCAELLANNYQVHVAFSWDNINLVPVQKGIKFKNLFFERKPSIFSNIKTIYELYFYFKKENFDAVEIHTPLASISGRIAAKLAAVKIVIYKVHGYYFHENMNLLNKYFHIILELFLSKLVDYIFTVSYEDTIFAKMVGFKKANKIIYLGNGIDKNLYYPPSQKEVIIARNKYGIDKDLFVIGIVARLIVEKGLTELIKAFDLMAINNKNIALFICGSKLKSDHNKGIHKELNYLKNKYKERVFLTGQLDHTYEAYRVMDVFCLPSYREGLPYTILEAMMTGIPVIASNIRGNREIITNNINGLLCLSKDVDSLKKCILDLYNNRRKRKNISRKGHKHVSENFELNKILKKEIQIIRQIIN